MNSIKRYLRRSLRGMRVRQDAPYCRAPVALATCDGQEGGLLRCNPAFADLLGYASTTNCLEQFNLSERLDACPANDTILTSLRALHVLSAQELSFKSLDGTIFSAICNLKLDPVSGDMDLAAMRKPQPLAVAEPSANNQLQLHAELENCREELRFSLETTGSTYWEWDLVDNRASTMDGTRTGVWPGFDPGTGSGDSIIDSVIPEDFQHVHQAIEACLNGNQAVFDTEFRVANPAGAERWLKAHSEVSMLDSRGRPQRLRGLYTDITELKQAEEAIAALQVQLFQAEKLHAIGQLTGGFAHDFNNILASVIGYTTLLLEKGQGSLDPSFKSHLLEVCKAGQLGQAMIARMLRFARNDSIEMAPAVISLLTRDAVQLIRPSMPSSIDLQLVIDDQLPSVKTNAFQLSQMLMNLCVNAKDAMQGAGQLKIHLELQNIARLSCTTCGQSLAGQYVQLTVADSGAGIDKRMYPHIFADFFTTKLPGEGTGMGLAIVNKLIHAHNGHLHVASVIGEGTRFSLLFPPTRRVTPGQEVIHLGASRFQPRKRGHVLVVDDDQSVGKYLAEVLRLHGHRATFESESLQALDLLHEKPHRFDVIITDQVMPDVTGTRLMESVHRIRRELPVVICSGNHDKSSEVAAMDAGALGYLAKPINVDKLLELVDRSLG